MALQVVLTLPQQRLHYLPRLLPIPSTYKLNGSSFGRPDVDLMFAKWAFNNDASVRELAGVSRLGIVKKKRNK